MEISKSFNILQSPISEASIEDMQLQFEFINEINSMVDNAHKSIKKMTTFPSFFISWNFFVIFFLKYHFLM